MPLPDCITRLLRHDLDLVEVAKISYEWTIQGAVVTPYFRDAWNTFALCDVKGYTPPEHQGQKEVWISVEILQRALELAYQIDITAVSLAVLDIDGKPSPVLALVGRESEIAITIAPRLERKGAI